MTYVILNISDSDKHWASAIWEYTKRLWKSVILENLKPCKNWTREQIIKKETWEILEKLSKKYKDWDYILMSKDGDLVSTEKLLDICKNKNTCEFWIPLNEKLEQVYGQISWFG